MSVVAEVVERTGARREDVIRVATTGGVSAADWVIAHAIEAVAGRPAADVMWAARARQAEPERPASTNPAAVYDPSVRVYEEATAPDAPQKPLPDYPAEVDQADEVEETEPGRAAWTALLETRVWPLVSELTGGAPGEVARVVRRWTTAREAFEGLATLMARRTARTPTKSTTFAAALAA